jgi:hypothetical protein
MTSSKSREVTQVLPIIDNFVMLGNLLKQLLQVYLLTTICKLIHNVI